MADQQDVERSFPATPQRLEKARAEGQVARSRELATAAVVLSAAIALSSLGPSLFNRCLSLFRSGLTLPRDAAFNDDRMLVKLHVLSSDMLSAIAPLLVLVLMATIAAPLLLSGWVFSWKAVRLDLARLDPLRGLSNIVSSKSLAELGKAVAKCVLLGGISVWMVAHSWSEMQQLAARDVASSVNQLGGLIASGFFALVGGLCAIALIDVPLQLWQYHRGLRMTREEVRQEQRESEGDPQLKAHIRSLQRSVARKRMMAAVPKADVIVTNPTHYAVALQYREGDMGAPRVIAKGIDLVAKRIREIGADHHIPLLEAPALARALYRHTEIGAEIPHAMYTLVAQVLAYVYQVQKQRRHGGPPPAPPADLSVPEGMDPLERRAPRGAEGTA